MDLTSRKGRLNSCPCLSSWNNYRSSGGNQLYKSIKPTITKILKDSHYFLFVIARLKPKQNCRLGADRCSHPGCSEAKLMYLHHKTCSAKGVEPCPTQHKGCQDARKLLAHYRRCREIRMKQSQLPNGKSRQQHVCLVCSLVARHAKFTLDRCVTASSKNGKSSHYIPSLNLSNDAYNGKRNRSKSFAAYSSSSTQEPRFAFSRRPNNGTTGARGFQALQAAAFALNSNSSKNGAKKSVKHSLGRPRAESVDVIRYQQQQQKTKEDKSNNLSFLLAAVDNFAEEIPEATSKIQNSTARRRSLSCSVPSRKQSSPGGGNSMLQNTTIAEDLQYILGGG